MVQKQVSEFKKGRPSTNVEPRSGRPEEVKTPEIIKKIYKIAVEERR